VVPRQTVAKGAAALLETVTLVSLLPRSAADTLIWDVMNDVRADLLGGARVFNLYVTSWSMEITLQMMKTVQHLARGFVGASVSSAARIRPTQVFTFCCLYTNCNEADGRCDN
jgi:hypothetical protein